MSDDYILTPASVSMLGNLTCKCSFSPRNTCCSSPHYADITLGASIAGMMSIVNAEYYVHIVICYHSGF